MDIRTYIDNRGRLVLPPIVKKELNYKPGDKLVLRVINEELHVISLDKILKEAQEILKITEHDKKHMLNDFLEYKRKEAAAENAKFEKDISND
jgi:bifunctional DNA-binding transcriptional regulator/antitoxin component of YhaV-PrlF toxin-antitoxin module